MPSPLKSPAAAAATLRPVVVVNFTWKFPAPSPVRTDSVPPLRMTRSALPSPLKSAIASKDVADTDKGLWMAKPALDWALTVWVITFDVAAALEASPP